MLDILDDKYDISVTKELLGHRSSKDCDGMRSYLECCIRS